MLTPEFTDLLDRVQEELRPGTLHNFGPRDTEKWQPLLGMQEELGELIESMDTPTIDVPLLEDSIADLLIYLCDFCNEEMFSLSTQIEVGFQTPDFRLKTHKGPTICRIAAELGKVAHGYLKRHQKIRLEENHGTTIQTGCGLVGVQIVHFCTLIGVDAVKVLSETWDKVKQRDWKKKREEEDGGRLAS